MAGGAREDRGWDCRSAGLASGSVVPDGFKWDAMSALSARLGADRWVLRMGGLEGKAARLGGDDGESGGFSG